MTDTKKLLGVLGGLGPMSTFSFCSLLTEHTSASCDQEHIDMIISSCASTPDRTAFILGKSTEDPLPVMRKERRRLEAAGVDLIVIPCNTAHYFYQGIAEGCRVPILNIIEETVRHLARRGVRRFGLLATEGTARSGAYAAVAAPLGMECLLPTEEEQKTIGEIIYHQIKQNRPADVEALSRIGTSLLAQGCEQVVLGCTELSLLRALLPHPDSLTDAMEVLALRTILACGRTPIGFSPAFSEEAVR